MKWKTGLSVSVAALGLMAWSPYSGVTPALAACMAGDHIDASTAPQAAKKMEQAGYLNAHDLKKGCDNYWHGIATREGKPVEISLSPQGTIVLEGMSRVASEGATFPPQQSAQSPEQGGPSEQMH
jgi:hypothetical protein